MGLSELHADPRAPNYPLSAESVGCVISISITLHVARVHRYHFTHTTHKIYTTSIPSYTVKYNEHDAPAQTKCTVESPHKRKDVKKPTRYQTSETPRGDTKKRRHR